MLHPSLPAQLRTERLTLRPIGEPDFPFLVELHADPEITRFLGGDGHPRSEAASREWFEKTRAWYADPGTGQYLIERTEDGRALGRAGLGIIEVETEPTRADGVPIASWGPGSARTPVRRLIEVGYTLAREHWGHGYASEAAGAWYRHVLEEREAPEVTSVIHPQNRASIRVATRHGLRAGERIHLEGSEYVVFRRRRDAPAAPGSK